MGKPLKSLEPRHHAAIRLRLEGKKNEDIARALGMQKRTLEVWFSDPLIKAEIERVTENIEKVFVEKLASAGFAALDVMLEIAQMPVANPQTTEYVKMEAAKDILDRTPALAKVVDKARSEAVRAEAAGGNGGDEMRLIQVFANMPDQQLAQFVQQWQVGEGDGAGDTAGQPEQA